VRTTRRETLGTLAAMLGGSTLASARQTAATPVAKPAAPAARPVAQKVATVSDFEPLAKSRMPHMAYEYVSGGAGDELTLRDNVDAFNRLRLHPRVLVDVSQLDTRTTILGQPLEFPILMAPTAYHRLMHPEGELATVRGAGTSGATMIASSFATTTIEDMSRAASSPLWFQLYCVRDRGFTKELVQRAEGAGCKALFVTVDSPVVGSRHRETRVGFTLPAGLDRANYRGLSGTASTTSHRPSERDIYSVVLDPTLTWKEIEWIRSFARVPVAVKGVLSPLDAATAVSAGVAAIAVSNHGARNLDTVPATIDALPRIADAVNGELPLFLDGGVRRGTDVLKALALGASAVLVGRPYLYGLAVQGADGVARVMTMLRTELEMAMALTGRRTLEEIDRSVLGT
jgi:4-hydroxymandelate oxidase